MDFTEALRSKYPIGEINDCLKYAKEIVRYKTAGLVMNEAVARERRREGYAKGHEHWRTKEPFRMTLPYKQEYRGDPHMTGWWNPVMWSDYPKQPAWTVPLPKLSEAVVCDRQPEVLRTGCAMPLTEHMDHVSYPGWFPDLPNTPVYPLCNPYVSWGTVPFHQTWGCMGDNRALLRQNPYTNMRVNC